MNGAEPISIGPFMGIDNRQPETRLGAFESGKKIGDYLQQADNVDLTDAGTLKRRPGFTQLMAGSSMHSLFGLADGTALVVDYDTLYLLTYADDALSKEAILTGLTLGMAMSYAVQVDIVFLSNGHGLWQFRNGAVTEVGIPVPQWTPMLSASTDGALPAGIYQVLITYRRSDGQESGSSAPVSIEVEDNGRLLVAGLPVTAPDGVETVCIYMTSTNGDQFFLAVEVSAGAYSVDVGTVPGGGSRCFTERMKPMPAGRMVRLYKGRLLVAVDSLLFRSQPYSPGLYDPTADYFQFPASITLMEPVEGGIFIVAGQTWFMPGDFDSLQMVLPYGAAKGSGLRREDDKGVFWFSERGLVFGADDGSVSNLQEEHLAVEAAGSAATLLREEGGLKQVLCATRNESRGSVAGARSLMDAEIIKQGTL